MGLNLSWHSKKYPPNTSKEEEKDHNPFKHKKIGQKRNSSKKVVVPPNPTAQREQQNMGSGK